MNMSSIPGTISSLSKEPASASRLLSGQSGRHTTQQPASELGTNPPGQSASALSLVEQTLKQAYEKLGLNVDRIDSGYSAFEPLTAEKVAGNILGFIERRLILDAAEGATAEQLQSRLEAGLAGFKQGFAEASEKLKALGMLNPVVQEDIGRTHNLVMEGIDRLRSEVIPQLLAPAPRSTAPQGSTFVAAGAAYHYAAASSFQFELMTAEGDKVSISASSFQRESFSYSGTLQNGHSATSQLQLSQSSATSLGWRVEGDLNDAELGAIGALLERLDRLASEFFKGNLAEAFNQALSLGYDQEQITRFSLTLTQVEVQRVSIAYREFADTPTLPALNEQLQPLGAFVRQLLDTLDHMPAVAEPRQLLLELAEKLPQDTNHSEQPPGQAFGKFLDELLQGLGL